MAAARDHILRFLTSVVPGVIRLVNDSFIAPGRNTASVACAAEREGAFRWTQGGTGVASVLEVCLKDGADAYAWETVANTDDVAAVAATIPTLVRTKIIHFIMYDGTTTNIWTNMPAAETELLNNAFYRKPADLSNVTDFRITCDVFTAGATGADLHLEYTTDATGATGWTDAGTQATQEIDIGTTGYRFGTWTALASGAKASVLLRFVGTSGNATADPFVTNLQAEFR